jgi:TrmH family RNA methyltransferase
MKVERIQTRNAAFQKFEVLKTNRNKRFRYQEFFVEGVRNLTQAVRNGWSIVSFLYTDERELSRWARDLLAVVETEVNHVLPASLLAELSGKEDTSELLAVVRMREDDLSQLRFSANPFLALFDSPSNHGNLGTVIRSCDALGVEALILTGHSVDPYDPAVVVASMGSFFQVPVVRVAESEAVQEFLDGMKAKYPRFQTVGTTAHEATPISLVDFTRPTLILIGNETDGLSKAYKDACDVLATIPMGAEASASSLNVACAATVVFYEALRQRS